MAVVPTKSNLISAKNTLTLCKTGYELLDKKRNILIHEMTQLTDAAALMHEKLAETFKDAYSALERANIDIGIETVEKIGLAIDGENGIRVKVRSVMGVEIPVVMLDPKPLKPEYGMRNTTSSLDETVKSFNRAKLMAAQLAQIENSVCRLQDSINKTQKRANALKNIMIPRYEAEVKAIQAVLDERDREEFSGLKVIKMQKENG